MKRLFFIGGFAAVLAASITASAFSAQAADKAPVYAAREKAAAIFNWTGFYVGAQVGYDRDKFSSSGLSDQPAGFTAGVHAGYRYQLENNLVLGIEADVSAGDVSSNTLTVVNDAAKLWGSVRGTLGYSFLGFMPYATAGWAWQRGEISLLGFKDEQMHSGWVYGAGIAAPITTHLIASVEWLHYDLSNATYTIPFGSASVDSRKDTYMAKLAYKF